MRAALVIALIGCSSESVLVAPEPEREVRSVIVAVERDDGPVVSMIAHDVGTSWRYRLRLAPNESLILLYYHAPLDALRLLDGVPPTTDAAPCARLAPNAVWRSDDHGEFKLSELRAAMAEQLVSGGARGCGICRTFAEDRRTVDGYRGDVTAAAPLPDGRVLGALVGALVAIDKMSVSPISGCEPILGPSRLLPIGGGRYEIADDAGRLRRIQIDVTCNTCRVLATRSSTPALPLGWISGSPDGAEVYALDTSGTVHRSVDAQPLERLAQLPLHPRRQTEGRTNRGGIAWIEPGQVVASAGAQELTWVTDDRVTRRLPLAPHNSQATVGAVHVIRDHVYVGDGDGEITRVPLSDDLPTLLPDNPLLGTIASIVPERDGFLATVETGLVLQYHPSVGFCAHRHDIAGVSARGDNAYFDRAGELVLPSFVGASEVDAQVIWLRSL